MNEMCKSRMQTDEILDMISSIARKKSKVRGNLRLEAILESTYKWLDTELKEKQKNRKRKWEEMKMDMCKKPKPDEELHLSNLIQMEDSYEDILCLAAHICDKIYLWDHSAVYSMQIELDASLTKLF